MSRQSNFTLAVLMLAAAVVIVSPVSNAGAVSKEKVILNFNGKNGSGPAVSLVADGAGNLYGTTIYGGAFGGACGGQGCGTVFELMPAGNGKWTRKTLHSFGRAGDGQLPNSSLILDSDGNLYGDTVVGGTSNFGTIFKLTPRSDGTWKESVLYNFTGDTDGGYPQAVLTLGPSGKLYGTATGGGIQASGCGAWHGCGVVFELGSNAHGKWTERVLYSLAGMPDGEFSLGGVIFDNAGNLYGTTNQGGTANSGTVFKLVPKKGSWKETVLHSFGSGTDGIGPVVGLTSDAAGNLYGTTILGGTSDPVCQGFACGTVFELKRGGNGKWTEKILYNFTNGIDGAAPGAILIFDTHGNLYSTAINGGANGTGCGGSGCGTVFELKLAANGQWTEKTLHSFGIGKDGSIPYGGVTFGVDGNLYGTTNTGGSKGIGTAFELAP